MKRDESKYEEHVCRCGWSERRLTGGTQLANHRGSCDAGVASVMSQQSRKLTLHCPFVPLNRKYTAQQMVHCHNTGRTLLTVLKTTTKNKTTQPTSPWLHDLHILPGFLPSLWSDYTYRWRQRSASSLLFWRSTFKKISPQSYGGKWGCSRYRGLELACCTIANLWGLSENNSLAQSGQAWQDQWACAWAGCFSPLISCPSTYLSLSAWCGN